MQTVVDEIYEYGRTTIHASQFDSRIAYALYVPHAVALGQRTKLIVGIHGTPRSEFLEFRDAFSEFCRWNNCVILCPLFPGNILGDGNRDGYKYLQEGDLRYDLALLAIVHEVAERYQQNWNRFGLFGYSGGGQFVHRFAFLHPERLWALSIGAPGFITCLDKTVDWWPGIRNLKEKFGVSIDISALAKVPVHMVVGRADIETVEINEIRNSRYQADFDFKLGDTRVERLRSLCRSFEEHGVAVKYEEIANTAHDALACMEYTKEFFFNVLQQEKSII